MPDLFIWTKVENDTRVFPSCKTCKHNYWISAYTRHFICGKGIGMCRPLFNVFKIEGEIGSTLLIKVLLRYSRWVCSNILEKMYRQPSSIVYIGSSMVTVPPDRANQMLFQTKKKKKENNERVRCRRKKKLLLINSFWLVRLTYFIFIDWDRRRFSSFGVCVLRSYVWLRLHILSKWFTGVEPTHKYKRVLLKGTEYDAKWSSLKLLWLDYDTNASMTLQNRFVFE